MFAFLLHPGAAYPPKTAYRLAATADYVTYVDSAGNECKIPSDSTHYGYAADRGNALLISSSGDLNPNAAIGEIIDDLHSDTFYIAPSVTDTAITYKADSFLWIKQNMTINIFDRGNITRSITQLWRRGHRNELPVLSQIDTTLYNYDRKNRLINSCTIEHSFPLYIGTSAEQDTEIRIAIKQNSYNKHYKKIGRDLTDRKYARIATIENAYNRRKQLLKTITTVDGKVTNENQMTYDHKGRVKSYRLKEDETIEEDNFKTEINITHHYVDSGLYTIDYNTSRQLFNNRSMQNQYSVFTRMDIKKYIDNKVVSYQGAFKYNDSSKWEIEAQDTILYDKNGHATIIPQIETRNTVKPSVLFYDADGLPFYQVYTKPINIQDPDYTSPDGISSLPGNMQPVLEKRQTFYYFEKYTVLPVKRKTK